MIKPFYVLSPESKKPIEILAFCFELNNRIDKQ